MKNVLLVSFILIYAGLFGQNICAPNWSNVKEYNRHTNLAELAIIDSAYLIAISHYDSASLRHSLFATDRYNKSVCYALMTQNQECMAELRYLMGKGLRLEMISDNSAFKSFLESAEGKQLLSEDIELTYDVKLRSIYDSLLKEDQYLRLMIPYGDEIKKIDSSNVFKMNHLIDKYGWPTDDLIGNPDLYEQVFSTIINHQRNQATRVYDYTDDLYEAYSNGKIEVHTAAWLISLMTNSNKFRSSDAGFVTLIYDSLGTYKSEDIQKFLHRTGFIKFSEDRQMMFDSNRLEFGLESINDLRTKVQYFKNDNRFRIVKEGWFSIYCYSEIEQFNFASGNIIPIE